MTLSLVNGGGAPALPFLTFYNLYLCIIKKTFLNSLSLVLLMAKEHHCITLGACWQALNAEIVCPFLPSFC